jgi:alanine racemase
VVKSNAYGHGIRQVSKIIQNEVDGFAINHISEINEIYDLGDNPILVMGGYEESDLKNLLDKDYRRIMLVLSNSDQLKILKAFLKKTYNFLLKLIQECLG